MRRGRRWINFPVRGRIYSLLRFPIIPFAFFYILNMKFCIRKIEKNLNFSFYNFCLSISQSSKSVKLKFLFHAVHIQLISFNIFRVNDMFKGLKTKLEDEAKRLQQTVSHYGENIAQQVRANSVRSMSSFKEKWLMIIKILVFDEKMRIRHTFAYFWKFIGTKEFRYK